MRKWRFYAIQIVLSLLLMEATLSLGYYFIKGKPIWAPTEVFNVRYFVQPVADERSITLRPGYANPAFRGELDDPAWSLSIDQDGFRKGLNRTRRDGPNVVFIGDSVPFGWAANDDETVPSKLQLLFDRDGDKRGIINAAIPSMSLDQAVHRYIMEVKDRFQVDTLILQIYDPIEQFVILGKAWDKSANWATLPRRTEKERGILQYSAIYHAAKKLWAVSGARTFAAERILGKVGADDFLDEDLDPKDDASYARFADSIDGSLDLLRDAIAGSVRRVLILPVTLPNNSLATLSPQYARALAVMNDTLRKYAESHAGFAFVDTVGAYGPRADNASLFRDECCHLTVKGAELQAGLIDKNL